jgi:hypothetical protein
VFEAIPYAPVTGPEVAYRSVDDIVAYCTDEAVHEALTQVLAELMGRGLDVTPQKGGKTGWLIGTRHGRPVTYLRPLRRQFVCQTSADPEGDGWNDHRISTYEEWAKQCRNQTLDLAGLTAEQTS